MSFSSPVRDLRARKQHTCTYCGERIAVGDMYKRWMYVEDSMLTNKMHPECLAVLTEEAKAYGGSFEYSLYEGERPK